jgi:predicted HicB family RNase H-like nuclease
MAGSIRARAASAVAKLKQHGEHDEAAAIESLLAPRGYLLLKRTEEGETSPLSLTVTADLKKALTDAAEEFDVVLDSLAEEAYRLVLAGQWLPPEAGRSKGGQKAVLQVSVDSRLRQEVQAKLSGLSQEAGYRVAESNIVLSHICEELGVERPGSVKAESLEMRFPKSLVQHWERQAEACGQSLQEIVEGRIPALVDGSWVPERNAYLTSSKRGPREKSWSESERQRLWLPVDKDLLADLRAKADELSAELGYLVYPGAVVRAILTDRLGEPAE